MTMLPYFMLALGLGLFADLTASRIGKACSSSYDCSDISYIMQRSKECRNGTCQCQPGIEVKFTESYLSPVCDRAMDSLVAMFMDCKEKPCGQNETCTEVENYIAMTRKYHKCFCNEGFLRLGQNCIEENHQSVLEECSGSEPIRTCNLMEHSICSRGKCICFDTYFANTTSGKCEPMKDYIAAHELTEYRVKPGEYCKDSSHCIEGLNCKFFKCECPSSCFYNPAKEICDCGDYEHPPNLGDSTPFAPIGVGIFLGILIISCWGRMIKSTAEKYKNARTVPVRDMAEVSLPSSVGENSYPLNPVSQNTTTDRGCRLPPNLPVPMTVQEGRHSPVLSSSLCEKNGLNSSGSPPSAPMQYGINHPSTPSYATPPPPYTETPLASDLPPPYSVIAPPFAGSLAPLQSCSPPPNRFSSSCNPIDTSSVFNPSTPDSSVPSNTSNTHLMSSSPIGSHSSPSYSSNLTLAVEDVSVPGLDSFHLSNSPSVGFTLPSSHDLSNSANWPHMSESLTYNPTNPPVDISSAQQNGESESTAPPPYSPSHP